MAYGAVFVMMTLISSLPKLPATQWASLDQRYYIIFNFRINCFNFFFLYFPENREEHIWQQQWTHLARSGNVLWKRDKH